MWLVKKAASKVAKISQNVLREESAAQKMIKDIISSKHEIMPVKKMSELVTLTYEIEQFQQTIGFISQKLQDIKMQRKSLKKRVNLLALISYLIKHGPSGFIDQFRAVIDSFTKYEILAINDSEECREIRPLLLEVSERANYVKILLTDKSVLTKEKELASIIKQKMMQQGGDYSQHSKDHEKKQQIEQKEEKVESFLQHYVWKYTGKLDKKMDEITDVLISKIDEYLDGEIPESFDIDQIDQKNSAPKKEDFQNKEKLKKEEELYMTSKMPLIPKKLLTQNLLDLDLEPSSGKGTEGRNLLEAEIRFNGDKEQVEQQVEIEERSKGSPSMIKNTQQQCLLQNCFHISSAKKLGNQLLL